jgi:hypothetical protein
MHCRQQVRSRILREMIHSLAAEQVATKERPAAAATPAQRPQPEASPPARWWRFGRILRRSEPAHTSSPARQ